MVVQPENDVALLMRAYAAYVRGDIDDIAAALRPDVSWSVPADLPNGGEYHGVAEVIGYLRVARGAWAELVSEITPYPCGHRVVMVHHVAGRLVDGSERAVTLADVHTVVDGRIISMVGYTSPAEALAEA